MLHTEMRNGKADRQLASLMSNTFASGNSNAGDFALKMEVGGEGLSGNSLIGRLRGSQIEYDVPDQLLTLGEVCEIMSISRSTAYNKLNEEAGNKYYDSAFPKRIYVSESGSAIRFSRREVLAYLALRIEARRVKASGGSVGE